MLRHHYLRASFGDMFWEILCSLNTLLRCHYKAVSSESPSTRLLIMVIRWTARVISVTNCCAAWTARVVSITNCCVAWTARVVSITNCCVAGDGQPSFNYVSLRKFSCDVRAWQYGQYYHILIPTSCIISCLPWYYATRVLPYVSHC
jgi:hypothetical protein